MVKFHFQFLTSKKKFYCQINVGFPSQLSLTTSAYTFHGTMSRISKGKASTQSDSRHHRQN